MSEGDTAPRAGRGSGSGGDLPPNNTLYCNNLNDKIKIGGLFFVLPLSSFPFPLGVLSPAVCNGPKDLKKELYLLMTQYGPVLDIVAQKTPVKRGQAFVVFRDVAAAAAAMRAVQGAAFLGKALRVQYAKTKSDAIAEIDGDIAERRRERVQRRLAAAAAAKSSTGAEGDAKAHKRPRSEAQEGEAQEGEAKKAKTAAPTASEEGEKEDTAPPNKMLLVTGLPDACTEAMLRALFSQVAGFVAAKLVPVAPGMAVVEYENEAMAGLARERLRGFRVDSTHAMSIAFMKSQ